LRGALELQASSDPAERLRVGKPLGGLPFNASLRLAGERDTAGVLRKRRFRGLVVAVAWRRQTCADDPSTLIIDVLVPIDFTWGVPPAVHARADFRSCTFLSTTSLCVGAKREIWRPSVATFDFHGLLPEN
jgi:hypothetical protein